MVFPSFTLMDTGGEVAFHAWHPTISGSVQNQREKGSNHAAVLWKGVSHLAITLAADLVDQLKGCALVFHSATKAIRRSAR